MIELLCEAIKREADNVIKATQDVEKILVTPIYKDKADMIDDMRVDYVLHLQTLITSLASEFFTTGEMSNGGPDESNEI